MYDSANDVSVAADARILIVRLSALGDVVHGLPVLNALREALPEAHLGWVVEHRAANVLERHPALDHLITVPRGWWKSPSAIWRLRSELRHDRFDITVDLQCLTKSAVAARLSGAPRRIGVAGPDGREFSKWLNNDLVPIRAQHVVEHYLALLQPLGITSPDVDFTLPHWPDAEQSMRHFLADQDLLPQGYAVLNPGAGWPSKLWPAHRYAAVAEFLGHVYGMASVAVWAGEDEHAMARRVVALSDGWARTAPPTSIQELSELSRNAALFVGSDTGPLHLAVASGAPSISLHGTTGAHWTGAYGDGNVRLQAYHDTATSNRRKATNRAMRAISVETVCKACHQILSKSLRSRFDAVHYPAAAA